MAWTITSFARVEHYCGKQRRTYQLSDQHDCRKPGSNFLATVTHSRHSTVHGKYGGDGSQDVGSESRCKSVEAEDGLSKFYD